MNAVGVTGVLIILMMMLKAGLSHHIVNVNGETEVKKVNVSSESEITEIIDFLNLGYKELKASKLNDIIYVLGPTGTGKSTLTHFVADNPSLLRSTEIDEDFVIQHVSEDKIRYVTLKSKTMYPDLIIDENNVTYYDCPGFSDTGNTSAEIAMTYFTREAISYAKRLKLVFVVNYQSMLRGISSRNDFLQFVKHATEFLRNVDPYSDGIMLMASKVNPVNVNAINQIQSFLKKYREILLEEEKQNPSPSNALKLIDIFLTKDRIGIFKRPTKSGLLSEIPEVMQNRAELLNIINEKLNFVKMNVKDFGYTLSDRSKLNINALGEELNRKITKLFGQMSQQVIEFYSLSVNCDDTDKLKSDFENTIKILSKISANISISDYLKAVSQLNIPNLQEYLVDIKKNIDYMKFLETIRNEPIVRRTSVWTQALQSSFEFLNYERNWCLFAEKLFKRLSEFDVQRNTSKYDVVNVELWGLGDGERTSNGIVINHQNFETFLRKSMDLEVELMDFQLAEHAKPVQSKIDLLNNILNTTLKSKPTSTCENNTLMVKGNFVKFSDLETFAYCDEVRLIEIFALFTVFVDKDFKKNIALVVIATKWYIHNTNTRIAVDGNDGDNYDTLECESERRTANINGKPGMAGQNANHFFGYGDEIVNSENLHISAVGGNGGRGQNGCNGLDAQEIPTPTDASSERSLCNYAKCQSIGKSSSQEIGFLYFNREYWNTETFQVYAGCPGVNGIGGSGGFGGFGGTIELNAMSEIIIKNGKRGLDGLPGECGKQENIEMCKSTDKSCTFWFFCDVKVTWQRVRKFSDTTCFQHCQSSALVNEIGISKPNLNKRPNFTVSVDKYKSFVRESLHTMYMNQQRATAKFLQSVEQNAEFRANHVG